MRPYVRSIHASETQRRDFAFLTLRERYIRGFSVDVVVFVRFCVLISGWLYILGLYCFSFHLFFFFWRIVKENNEKKKKIDKLAHETKVWNPYYSLPLPLPPPPPPSSLFFPVWSRPPTTPPTPSPLPPLPPPWTDSQGPYGTSRPTPPRASVVGIVVVVCKVVG